MKKENETELQRKLKVKRKMKKENETESKTGNEECKKQRELVRNAEKHRRDFASKAVYRIVMDSPNRRRRDLKNND